jgi:hypothetical protein
MTSRPVSLTLASGRNTFYPSSRSLRTISIRRRHLLCSHLPPRCCPAIHCPLRCVALETFSRTRRTSGEVIGTSEDAISDVTRTQPRNEDPSEAKILNDAVSTDISRSRNIEGGGAHRGTKRLAGGRGECP